jgi:hypothetical protein
MDSSLKAGAKPGCVINGGVDATAGNGITDPKQCEAILRMPNRLNYGLLSCRHRRGQIYFTPIDRRFG